jgi:hypothetical protein
VSFDSNTGIPVRSIDRKLDALRKRLEKERASKPMTKPIDGLTSTLSTENNDIPLPRKPPTL